jgi:hypothetical protein
MEDLCSYLVLSVTGLFSRSQDCLGRGSSIGWRPISGRSIGNNGAAARATKLSKILRELAVAEHHRLAQRSIGVQNLNGLFGSSFITAVNLAGPNQHLPEDFVPIVSVVSPLPTILLPRWSVLYRCLPPESFGAPVSCLPPDPRHQGSRRSERIVESLWRYNRWDAHRSR